MFRNYNRSYQRRRKLLRRDNPTRQPPPMPVKHLWAAGGRTGVYIHILPPSRKRDLFTYGHVEMTHVLPPAQERVMEIYMHGNVSEGEQNKYARALGYLHCDQRTKDRTVTHPELHFRHKIFNRPFEWTTLDERVISSLLRRWEGPVTITAGLHLLTGVPNDFDDQIDNEII